MTVNNFSDLIKLAKQKERKTLAVAYAQDLNTLSAVNDAVDQGIANAILTGCKKTILKVCAENNIDASKFEIVDEPDEVKSGMKAVELIHNGKAHIIMKGLIGTDKFMRCILNKEKGLLLKGRILSHVTVVKTPLYHKMLVIGDAAIIPTPDLKQKAAIANYLLKTAKSLGIDTPKLAVIAATEKANPKMPACVDAALLAKMNDRGQIKGGIIDGPLALDVAISKKACEIKGLTGEVCGDADCLLFPNIDAGNVFYKCMAKLTDSEMAAMVVGTDVPAVLTSRGDSHSSKLYAIALAALQ